MIRRSVAIAALLTLASACGSEPSSYERETTASSAEPIISGAADPGDDAVVSLFGCTGTLVAPRVVLTAAHCVSGTGFERTSVQFGSTLTSASEARKIVETKIHPAYDLATFTADIALVLLDSPAPTDIAVMPIARASLDTTAGAGARIVGFGITSNDDTVLQKNSGTSLVSEVDASTLSLAPDPSLPCVGDSGGPVLLRVDGTELVAGVISHGDVSCAAGATAMRVDVYAAFVDSYVESVAASADSGGGGSGARGCSVARGEIQEWPWPIVLFLGMGILRRKKRSVVWASTARSCYRAEKDATYSSTRLARCGRPRAR